MRTKTVMKSELKRVVPFVLLSVLAVIACLMRVNGQVAEQVAMNSQWLRDALEGGNLVGAYVTELLAAIQKYVTVGILLLVLFQFYEIKKGKTQEFLQSLPVKRSTWFWCRYAVGTFVITLPCVIAMIGSLILRACYQAPLKEANALSSLYGQIKANDKAGSIVLAFVTFWLVAMAIYSVLYAFQVFVNNALGGMLVGFGALGVPYVLFHLCENFVYAFYQGNVEQGQDILGYIERTAVTTLDGGGGYVLDVGAQSGNVKFVFYHYPYVTLVIWAAVIAVFGVLAFQVWKHQDSAHSEWIFANKTLEIAFAAGLSLCLCSLAFHSVAIEPIYIFILEFCVAWVVTGLLIEMVCKRIRTGGK